MRNWQTMETAPRDGRMIIGYWHIPVLMAYFDLPDEVVKKKVGKWPFKHKEKEIIRNRGWRVVTMGRNFDFYIHGNYGPINPTHWMPFPESPFAGVK